MGFDDLDQAYYTDPPLTTIKQHFYEIGRKAAEFMLSDKILEENDTPWSELIVPALVERESCAVPKV
jgi:LacI family transcriptional regulator